MMEAAGVDTWSVCWYLREGSPGERAMQAMATVRAARSNLIEQDVAGHRVGWFPGSRMLFAEGHPSSQGLCKAEQLPVALEQLRSDLGDLGILPPAYRFLPVGGALGVARPFTGGSGFGGVRRLDCTVDLAFDRAAEGLAALAGVASLPLPRIKTKVIREVGGRRVETVYFHGSAGRSVLGRWYDKGIESGDAARGRHIRPEDQRRFAKDARLPVDLVAEPSFLRDTFVKRFEPLWRASKGVKVGSPGDLGERLIELQEAGELTGREAVTLAGHLLLDSCEGQRQSRATRYRHRGRCRDLGLVLADGVDDQVEVDLGEICERAMDSDAWGAEG